jgi:hypothetical protein
MFRDPSQAIFLVSAPCAVLPLSDFLLAAPRSLLPFSGSQSLFRHQNGRKANKINNKTIVRWNTIS